MVRTLREVDCFLGNTRNGRGMVHVGKGGCIGLESLGRSMKRDGTSNEILVRKKGRPLPKEDAAHEGEQGLVRAAPTSGSLRERASSQQSVRRRFELAADGGREIRATRHTEGRTRKAHRNLDLGNWVYLGPGMRLFLYSITGSHGIGSMVTSPSTKPTTGPPAVVGIPLAVFFVVFSVTSLAGVGVVSWFVTYTKAQVRSLIRGGCVELGGGVTIIERPEDPLSKVWRKPPWINSGICTTLPSLLTLHPIQSSAQSLVGTLLAQNLRRITSQVLYHVKTAENAAATSKLNWGEGHFDPGQPLLASAMLFNVLLAYVDVFVTQTFTLVAGGDGSLFGHWARQNGSGQIEYVEWMQFGPNYTQQQDIDPANTTAQAWTLSYVWESVIWQTFSANIYARNGSYLGVTSTDLTLDFLTRVLTAQSEQLLYENFIYAFEIGANGEVCLGSSNGVDLYHRDSSNVPQRSLMLPELTERSKPMAALDGLLAGSEWNGSVAAFATAKANTETPTLVDFGGTTQLHAPARQHPLGHRAVSGRGAGSGRVGIRIARDWRHRRRGRCWRRRAGHGILVVTRPGAATAEC
ncbi:hypothetical protein BDK51DRAFT_45645 [Blyttiomyces helicus]|uniref:Uncharacterized protein n=1 Tax=Blyttiomyces helicus TaxID=388810 RepID=A0A4P9WGJ9_9FUNG|nr:hypothetical protein BDK51DRAFT_45645 [Blyttiomyces helicus]|eukprot:RKO91462.1 hypothetical protein BDK51DRAFT_45645 [Blyttiomyces helicus]